VQFLIVKKNVKITRTSGKNNRLRYGDKGRGRKDSRRVGETEKSWKK
jgi:hypothetical protein